MVLQITLRHNNTIAAMFHLWNIINRTTIKSWRIFLWSSVPFYQRISFWVFRWQAPLAEGCWVRGRGALRGRPRELCQGQLMSSCQCHQSRWWPGVHQRSPDWRCCCVGWGRNRCQSPKCTETKQTAWIIMSMKYQQHDKSVAWNNSSIIYQQHEILVSWYNSSMINQRYSDQFLVKYYHCLSWNFNTLMYLSLLLIITDKIYIINASIIMQFSLYFHSFLKHGLLRWNVRHINLTTLYFSLPLPRCPLELGETARPS